MLCSIGGQPFGDELGWKLRNKKAYSRNRLTDILNAVLILQTHLPERTWLGLNTTHVVTARETKIIEEIVRHGIGDVVSIDVQGSEHDAHPDLRVSDTSFGIIV